GLSRRYFRPAAKSIGVAWSLAAGSDLAFPEVEGRRTRSISLTNRYIDWVLTACETDAVVGLQFLRVSWLVDPPARLFQPSFVYRVAAANRRRRQRDSQPV
ncbi:MAG TPA: 2-polyprenyl-6-methoxyphenol hydroxylase-like oxidoreductase, partial [Mycobacterium sp.]|nr:2-polyprenyl-6-methoxyphenol hydroxylase-like oxidoreductase [Mycobacterium sp.]